MNEQNPTEKITQVVEDSTKRMQDAQETIFGASKQAALTSINAYEKSVNTVLDLQKKYATSTGIEAIDEIVNAQVKFVSDLNASTVSAARSILA